LHGGGYIAESFVPGQQGADVQATLQEGEVVIPPDVVEVLGPDFFKELVILVQRLKATGGAGLGDGLGGGGAPNALPAGAGGAMPGMGPGSPGMGSPAMPMTRTPIRPGGGFPSAQPGRPGSVLSGIG
jgi:hypothetical protein